ncbi:hypothetical protein AYX15_07154 [Cryptococcus neoformans]|nr:hypothetical protein AYX15_07154 [Cryptococcus neoformans var. grubii]
MNGVSAAVTKSEDLSILLVFSINTTQPVFSISNPNNRAFVAFAVSKLFFAPLFCRPVSRSQAEILSAPKAVFIYTTEAYFIA